jgi:hypothetical protein
MSDDKVYIGKRAGLGAARVFVEHGDELNPRLDLRNHSPDGFEWGYFGSGPAQLALALLCDATGDDAIAQKLYQTFKAEVIAPLKADEWRIPRANILAFVANQKEVAAND